MSRMNCLRPSSGFCLNLRVLIVNSDIPALSASGEQVNTVRDLAVCQLRAETALE